MMKFYIIEKGGQRTTVLPRLHIGCKKIEKLVILDKSCKYDQPTPGCYFQLNTIFGISYGFNNKNSFTFGWRCIDQSTIEIVARSIINGETTHHRMTDIHVDKKYKFTIEYDKESKLMIYTIKDFKKSKHIYGISYLGKTYLGLKHYPRFGTNCVSPKHMFLQMN